jgi:O-antigen/teichoic acid export membrane protein
LFISTGKNRQFLQQLSWAAFGQIATAVGLLVGIRLMTEYVPPSTYGNVTLLLGLTTFAYSLFSVPLFQASLRFYPNVQKSGDEELLRFTVFELAKKAMVSTSVLMIIGGAAYGFLTGNSGWFGVLLAAILVVDVIKMLETGLLNAARKQREFAFWNISETWGRPVCAIILVSNFQASAGMILFGYFCASALVLLYFRPKGRAIKGEESMGDRGQQRHRVLVKDIYRYALPLVPSALVSGVNSLSDRYIIGGGLGFEQLGIYAAASSLMIRPFVIACGIIEQSVRPIYFDSVASESSDSKFILRKWLLFASGICVSGILLVVGLRHQIVNLVLAPKYRSVVDLLPWLALGYACYSISFIYENVFYAYKKTVVIFKINTIMAVITVFVTLMMTYAYGLLGAALSVAIINILKLILLRFCYAKIVNHSKNPIKI